MFTYVIIIFYSFLKNTIFILIFNAKKMRISKIIHSKHDFFFHFCVHPYISTAILFNISTTMLHYYREERFVIVCVTEKDMRNH